MAARGRQARARAAHGLGGTPWRLTGQVPGSWLRSASSGREPALLTPLMAALDRGDLTLRGVDRVLRLAWTLADLAARPAPTAADLGGALALRTRGARL